MSVHLLFYVCIMLFSKINQKYTDTYSQKKDLLGWGLI